MNESANKPLELKKRLLSNKQKQQHNFSLGNSGEQQAISWLEQHGFVVMDQNVRVGNSEVDIIAWDKRDTHFTELVFIEVKTRKSENWGNPSNAVNQAKIRSMQKVAHAFLQQHHINADYRFDIITLVSGTIHHYQNITWG